MNIFLHINIIIFALKIQNLSEKLIWYFKKLFVLGINLIWFIRKKIT